MIINMQYIRSKDMRNIVFVLCVMTGILMTVFCAVPFAAADTVAYTYDNAGRLIDADYGSGTGIEYTYDEAGNLLKRETQGQAPDITVDPTSKDFGNVDVGTISPPQTFTVSNSGTGDLVIGTLTLTGGNASEFVIQNDNCSNKTIPPGGNATVDVAFSPQSEGAKGANLTVPSNDPVTPTLNVLLTGQGVIAGYVINPSEGTKGTEFTIAGGGFGDRKGRVYIGNKRCQIGEWTDASITGVINSVPPPGAYDVKVYPRNAEPIILKDAFDIMPAEIESVDPELGSPGDEITITGAYFGIANIDDLFLRRAMVLLKYRNCKIVTWWMSPNTGASRIVFKVPLRIPKGVYDVTVSNDNGRIKDTAQKAFTVE